jgi:hypothetical protein
MSAAAGSAVLKQASAPWYRATLMLPIAPSVGCTTTRRPGRIWATMVSGVLAHKSKKRAAQAALFLCSTLSMLDNRPDQIESSKLHILRAAFLLAAVNAAGN